MFLKNFHSDPFNCVYGEQGLLGNQFEAGKEMFHVEPENSCEKIQASVNF